MGLSPSLRVWLSPFGTLGWGSLALTLLTVGLGIYYCIIFTTYGGCERPIPAWILVVGIYYLVYFVLVLCIGKWITGFSAEKLPTGNPDEEETAQCLPEWMGWLPVVNQLIMTFLFWAWFIVGNVFTFSIDRDDCDTDAYDLAFIYIIIVWVLFGLSLIFGAIFLIYWLAISDKGYEGMKAFWKKWVG